MDSRMLKKKQEFKELRGVYVIFICQHDKFGEGEPVYHIDKVIRECGKRFADGVKHFTETKEGYEIICDSFERLANKVGDQ